ncbi:MAG TPA: DUF502 domain-containing protein [Tepidisphaeraceae bacterium]|jgi:uncharacterized membrane protein
MSAHRRSFAADFRHFFLRGLTALLPTLITLWLLVKIWEFLWETLGIHLIAAIQTLWYVLAQWGLLSPRPAGFIDQYFAHQPPWLVELIGVALAILLVYFVGLLLGNLAGRTLGGLAEMALLRIPIIRAIYPAVKQITDYVLAGGQDQIQASHVVAVQPHENGIWSIGLLTGAGVAGLVSETGEPLLSVFIPSSPTAFSGYVLLVPKSRVVELPMRVEEAMKMLISGGVLSEAQKKVL